MSPQQTTVEPN